MPSIKPPRAVPDTTRRLITGGTGFMGSHFLLELHCNASHTTVLVRGENPGQSFARLSEKVQGAASSCARSMDSALFERRVNVVVGDICQDACGVSDQDVGRLAGCIDELWHFAASLQFETRSRDKIFKHNVDGVRQVIALAAKLGCQRFVYISTAYTVGCAGGDVAELLHNPQGPFNNLYEESKCLAEHVVSQECQRLGMQARILRPSIVVGPSNTLRTGGSDSGLYGFASEIYRLRGQFQRLGSRIAVQGDPRTPLNCIPIDYVVQDLLYLARTQFVGVGPILHLTVPHGMAIEQVGDMITKHAHTPGFEIGLAPLEQRAPIEVLFDRRTTFYGSYLSGKKHFVRSLPPHPELSLVQVDGYIAQQYKELREQGGQHFFKRNSVLGRDGTTLRSYQTLAHPNTTAKPCVVLVNAYGMPVGLMLPLAQALSHKFHVLTWESRGVPDVSASFNPLAVSVGDHAADLVALLDAHNVERAHVVGWCTGAQVALRFASDHSKRLQGLVLLNGCYTLPASVQISAYRELVRELMREVATQPEFAKTYYAMIYGKKGSGIAGVGVEIVSDVLNFTDPDLLHLTSAPFQSSEALYRYAVMMTRFNQEPEHAWTLGLSAQTLVVSGSKDTIAHPQESWALHKLVPGSQYLELPQGNHFSMYHDTTLQHSIVQFLQACALDVIQTDGLNQVPSPLTPLPQVVEGLGEGALEGALT